MARPSPFLEPGAKTSPGTLAIVVLSRDNYQPITLQQSEGAVDGYAEGAVLNTKFGSFPHSTLLDIPWGSQVRASTVDTGSRGRKRKREGTEDDASTPYLDNEETPVASAPAKRAVTAKSGFVHILRPTPELWTSSLPHRTQVVYTPDYSYILHRIRARPGSRIIEAGAGSGSFTHASARAVYNGYPDDQADGKGKVFSFEFHESRFHKMTAEIKSHSLEGIVEITHRDVYKDGFLVNGKSPDASAVFLDLPAPWEALHHLCRRRAKAKADVEDENVESWTSPLDPKKAVHICTFSPCIEQVMRTVTELRSLGWRDIDMVEVSHRRLIASRDRVGLSLPTERGFNKSPTDVTEAVAKLKEVNNKTRDFHKNRLGNASGDAPEADVDMDVDATDDPENPTLNGHGAAEEDDRPWMQGRLVHRSEPELKTHTSYLVFAILPREWCEDDEAAAMAAWPCGKESGTIGNIGKEAQKKAKRDKLESQMKKKQQRRDYSAQG